MGTSFVPWDVPLRIRGIKDMASYHHVRDRALVLELRGWAVAFCGSKLGSGMANENTGDQSEGIFRSWLPERLLLWKRAVTGMIH